VLVHPDAINIRQLLKRLISVASIWFIQPIIGSNDNLEKFGYYEGMCPISEETGRGIINIPCNISELEVSELIFHLKKILSK
jgi:hypothetical protein